MMKYEFCADDAFRFVREIGATAKAKGDELHFALCPYCQGGNGQKRDKGTFSINLKDGRFKCLRASCNAHGNMITLAHDFDFSLGEDIDAYYGKGRKFRKIHTKEKPISKPAAVAYMESRGISEAVTLKYNITVQRDRDNILVFPFYDENNMLQFVKYRKTDFDKERDSCKEWCEKDCKPILFGMNHCNFENETLVLTEGQIDSLSCVEAGVENAVSVPTGAKGFTWVPYCWDFLARFSTIVIFGDFEHGSISLLEEMKKRFHGAVRHVSEEDYKGCKDANEILRKYGAQAVADAVKSAVAVTNPKIIRLADVRRVDESKMPGFKTGIYSLDQLLGKLYFGQLVLLTGKRGKGKSTLASQLGLMAINAGYTTLFYSGELNNWYFKMWFERQTAGARYINKIKKNGKEYYHVDARYLYDIERWYYDKALLYDNEILLEEDGTEEESLLKILKDGIVRNECKVIIVDNLMTAMEDDSASDLYRQQTVFVKELAKMAKQYEVLILLIAHPRKSINDRFENDDVAGSSNITNLVDVVMRYDTPKDATDPDTPERTLTIHKNRLTGKTNSKGIKLYFQESSKRISEHEGLFDLSLGWEHQEPEWQDAEDDGLVFD